LTGATEGGGDKNDKDDQDDEGNRNGDDGGDKKKGADGIGRRSKDGTTVSRADGRGDNKH
jgi:hypothetical protein